jgi:glycerol-3-phosphate O-acyltransferase
MDAQYENFVKAEKEGTVAKKIIICPSVINYHFVLEAPELIRDYLQETGKEQYLGENDKYSTSFKLLRLIFKLLTQSSKIYISYGKPMDLFGNLVDEQGNSIDKHGNNVDIKKYFMLDGALKYDQQRHEEYVKMLGEKIAHSYKENCVVMSSNLVAFVAFRILMKRYKKLDLYALMLLPKEDRVIKYDEFKNAVVSLRATILERNQQGKIRIASHFANRDSEPLIEHGLTHLGMYHDRLPLVKNAEGDIQVSDMKLLYFYHNRLTGFGFEAVV